jgi:putative inorganic carbon (hco3(-)) transporter
LSFLLTLVYIALLFVRPFELGEEYAELPVMAWLALVTIVATFSSWFLSPTTRRTSLAEPQMWLTVTFLFLAVLPWLMIGWLEEVSVAVTELQPTLGAFLMIFMNVNTMKRMRWVVAVLLFSFAIMVGQGLTSYYTGWQHELFVMDQRQDVLQDDEQAEPTIIPRLRHLGFLNDPNDFAQALITMLPLAALSWRPRRYFVNFAVVLPLAASFMLSILLTRSRGGLVAVAVTTLLALRDRMGRTKSAILTSLMIAALVAFNFGAGRAFSDESAEGRIEAWASGLMILREHPLVGVGYNGFVEAHRGLTAHNSFVLAFSETGLIGYFVWMALIVVTYMELGRLMRLPGDEPLVDETRRWAGCLRLAMSAFLAGAYFLSRTYVVTLYLLIALAVCLKQIAARQGAEIEEVRPIVWAGQTMRWQLISIFVVWLSVKLAAS